MTDDVQRADVIQQRRRHKLGNYPLFRVPSRWRTQDGRQRHISIWRVNALYTTVHLIPSSPSTPAPWEATVSMMVMGERACGVPGNSRAADHQSSLSMYSDLGALEIIPGDEARSRFYEAYKRHSNRFDKELKEYNKELNITLLFVRSSHCLPCLEERRITEKLLTWDRNHWLLVRPIRCGHFDLSDVGTEHSSPSHVE